jgi:hypothetical protein
VNVHQANADKIGGGGDMVILVLFVVTMFLWFLANLPVSQAAQYADNGRRWLAFIAVVLLGVYLFMPGVR